MTKRTCSIEGCEKPVDARGWCGMHYQRWRHGNDPLMEPVGRPSKGLCSIEGCGRPHQALGFCTFHYQRLRRFGDALWEPQQRTCSVDGCDRKHYIRSWCILHWSRWDRHGDPLYVRPPTPERVCSVDGCERKVLARGWCERHYDRWERWGDPLGAHPGPEERFWAAVRKGEGCWPRGWSDDPTQRSTIHVNGRDYQGHVYAWVLRNGPVPPGMRVCHTCDLPACVRNDDDGTYELNGVLLPRSGHLFLGTPADNSADMAAKGRGRKAFLDRVSRMHPAVLGGGCHVADRGHP